MSHLFIFFRPKTQSEQRLAPRQADGQVRTQDCLERGQQAAEAHLPNVSAGAASVSPSALAQGRWWEHRCGAPAGSCLRGPGSPVHPVRPGPLGPEAMGGGDSLGLLKRVTPSRAARPALRTSPPGLPAAASCGSAQAWEGELWPQWVISWSTGRCPGLTGLSGPEMKLDKTKFVWGWTVCQEMRYSLKTELVSRRVTGGAGGAGGSCPWKAPVSPSEDG